LARGSRGHEGDGALELIRPKAILTTASDRLRSVLSSVERPQAVWAFAATALMFFVLHQLKAVTVYPADSGGYWGLAGRVAILDFPKYWRGYFYPMLLSPARVVGYVLNSPYPYRLYASAAYAFLLAVVVPDLYVRVFGGRMSFTRRLVAPALLALLAPGVMVYPLSDLPAVLLLICSLYLILLSSDSPSRATSYRLMLAAGVLAGAAYNTRTIYLFSLIMVVLVTALWWTRARSPRHRTILIATLLLGIGIVSLPQAFINLNTHGSFTPAVITTQVDPKSLFAAQLTAGIRVQRYETSLDPLGPVLYLDPAGQRLLASAGLDNVVLSPRDYLAFAARYPIDLAGILARHAINGLDLRDGNVYLVDPANPRWLQSTLNYLVLFLAGWTLFIRARSTRGARGLSFGDAADDPLRGRAPRGDWFVWLAVLLMPVAAILPGQIETRFFLPLHLLAYYTIAMGTSWAELRESLRARWYVILPSLVGLCFLFVTVTANTLSHRVLPLP
jgi:hypothetical protein